MSESALTLYTKMKLASHNTMTYLKPKKWYMNLFRFIGKCQSKAIEEQYESGVRWFDLRISFDKKCEPEFRHGLIAYKGNVFDVLDYLNTKDDVMVRILLEKDNPLYYNFCEYIELNYPNLKFCGGYRKSDWKPVYIFKKNPIYTMEENYSSMPSNPKWYSIWPWLYSKLHKKNYTDKDYLLIDFI